MGFEGAHCQRTWGQSRGWLIVSLNQLSDLVIQVVDGLLWGRAGQEQADPFADIKELEQGLHVLHRQNNDPARIGKNSSLVNSECLGCTACQLGSQQGLRFPLRSTMTGVPPRLISKTLYIHVSST